MRKSSRCSGNSVTHSGKLLWALVARYHSVDVAGGAGGQVKIEGRIAFWKV